MNCAEIQELLNAYADGELDLLRSVEIEEHLKTCRACARAVGNIRALRAVIRSNDLSFPAPAGLHRRVLSSLPAKKEKSLARVSFLAWPGLRWAYSFAGVALVAVVLTAILLNNSGTDRLAREVASSHVRSLMAGHLMDVASTDQHTVKPWFDGKLDFAPPVVDLADHGFPLVGGRLDYLHDRPVAALVYQRQKHFINLFIWPASGKRAPERPPSVNGYNLVHWDAAGMTCWAVSDLNGAELGDFADLFKSQVGSPPAAK